MRAKKGQLVRRENDSNNSKPNQNHWGAAMHTAAATALSIAINRKQPSRPLDMAIGHWT